MVTIIRKIIEIDEAKCTGCALCIPACPEGALQIIDGKAKLVKEQFCDGLGACLGGCPEDALHIIEREVEYYDAKGVVDHIKQNSPEQLEKHMHHIKEHESEIAKASAPSSKSSFAGCPGSKMMQWVEKEQQAQPNDVPRLQSELRQWPVQLHLVPPGAPYFKNADISLIADCVPFSYPNFHADFVKGKAIAVGCPKLDDVSAYLEKITQIIKQGKPKSLTVVYMEVPCCGGLVHLAAKALSESNHDIPLKTIKVSIRGEILAEDQIQLKAG